MIVLSHFYVYSFKARVIETTKCGDLDAVIVEVQGHGYYTGTATYTVENNDPLKNGFLISWKAADV